MNIKIITHFMPWEIDHALILADRLKQNSYNLDKNDTIIIDSTLNLSSYIIDWDRSILPKQFFIEKYKTFEKILSNVFLCKSFIYEGNELYGHLDAQKKAVEKTVDFYIHICPDIDISNHLMYYLIEYAKQVKNEYFVITPQIFKCWDHTWDVLVNDIFNKYKYIQNSEIDIHKIKHQTFEELSSNEVEICPLETFKYAGWCDLYNKNFYEKLVPVASDWVGYGPWDFYGMNICNIAKRNGVDVKQFILKNEIIWFYDNGILRDEDSKESGDGILKSTYKKFLTKKIKKNDQTNFIYSNINFYLNKWVEYAINSNIIKK